MHGYNYGDIAWWDQLFGTFEEADEFVPACGFPRHNERRVWETLTLRDVYAKR